MCFVKIEAPKSLELLFFSFFFPALGKGLHVFFVFSNFGFVL